MNVRQRLARLEKANNTQGAELCTCGLPARVLWGDDGTGAPRPEPGPERCPICGRVRQTLRVVYGDNPESEALA